MLPIFIDEVPEYEVRGDVVHVRWRGLEIAIPISICVAAVRSCNEALAKWQIDQLGRVVSLSDH